MGKATGSSNTTENNNTFIGFQANGAAGITNATAIGAGALVNASNTMVLGTSSVTVKVPGSLSITDFVSANQANLNNLLVNNQAIIGGEAVIGGPIFLESLGAAGSTSLCLNASSQIATCSSSLRYKTRVRPFLSGLEIISRLRPIAFTWKTDDSRDLGLGAEDVAVVEPLLIIRSARGEVEGVKYDRLNVVLINAVKQQQQQIEQLQNQLHQQQSQTEGLKKLVCLDHPTADVCKWR